MRVKDEERRQELLQELAEHEMPVAGLHLWLAYRRLRRRKGGNGYGAMPLEFSDIGWFMMVTGKRLAPWEIEILEDFDDAYMAEQSRMAKASRDKPKGK